VLIHILLGVNHHWAWGQISQDEKKRAVQAMGMTAANSLAISFMCLKCGHVQSPELFGLCFSALACCQLCVVAMKSLWWTRRREITVAESTMTICSFIACKVNAPDQDFTTILIQALPLLTTIYFVTERSTQPAEILGTVNVSILAFKLLHMPYLSKPACLLFATDVVTVKEQSRWFGKRASIGAQGARTMSVITNVLTTLFMLLFVLCHTGWRVYMLSMVIVTIRIAFLHKAMDERLAASAEDDDDAHGRELKASLLLSSDEVEASRHGVVQTVNSGLSELGDLYGESSCRSVGDIKSLGKKLFDIMKAKATDLSDAMGSWRMQQYMTMGSCLYSILSMTIFIQGIKADDESEESSVIMSPRNAAISALLLSLLTVLICITSILKDYGFDQLHAIDKNFKMATCLKAMLISLKLIVNFQMPPQTSFLVHFMLISAAWVSLLMQMVLTCKETSNPAIYDILGHKVLSPESIKKIYKVLWLCTKGGLAILLMGASFDQKSVFLIPWSEVEYCFLTPSQASHEKLYLEKSVYVSVAIAVTLASSSVLTNELARMMEDPKQKFTATLSADGARTVVGYICILSSCTLAYTLWQMVSCCFVGIATILSTVGLAGVVWGCLKLSFKLGDTDVTNLL